MNMIFSVLNKTEIQFDVFIDWNSIKGESTQKNHLIFKEYQTNSFLHFNNCVLPLLSKFQMDYFHERPDELSEQIKIIIIGSDYNLKEKEKKITINEGALSIYYNFIENFGFPDENLEKLILEKLTLSENVKGFIALKRRNLNKNVEKKRYINNNY